MEFWPFEGVFAGRICLQTIIKGFNQELGMVMFFFWSTPKKEKKKAKVKFKKVSHVPKIPLNAQPAYKAKILFQQHGIDPAKYQGSFNAITSLFRQWQKMEQTGDRSGANAINKKYVEIFNSVLRKEGKA
jgi:hypothetical protein